MTNKTSETKVPYSKVKELADRPYAFTLRPVEDGFEITFPELPGCVTQVDSLDDVNTKIRQVKRTWITALLESGYQIPEPRDNVEFSGRILLRCSSTLHRALVEMADLEGTSLNQLLVQASSQWLGFKQAKSMSKSMAEETTGSVRGFPGDSLRQVRVDTPPEKNGAQTPTLVDYSLAA